MALIRILVIFIVLWLVVRLVRRHLLPPGRGGVPRKAGKMLRCEHCGTFVPAEEAVSEDGHVYCSQEHRRLAGEGDGD
ncbi:MAG: hypothetical protein D6786_03565 [Gammaproteobacteria bacterium]|nr:MAG: hypothetical protein D6786_03565 [Gammaproteobacteria bacterium]